LTPLATKFDIAESAAPADAAERPRRERRNTRFMGAVAAARPMSG